MSTEMSPRVILNSVVNIRFISRERSQLVNCGNTWNDFDSDLGRSTRCVGSFVRNLVFQNKFFYGDNFYHMPQVFRGLKR